MAQTLSSDDIGRLIQQLDADRRAYLESHNKLQEALVRILNVRDQAEGIGSGPGQQQQNPSQGSASTYFPPHLQSQSPDSTPQATSIGTGTATAVLQLEPPTPGVFGLSSFTAEPRPFPAHQSSSLASDRGRPGSTTSAGERSRHKRNLTSVYSAEDSSDSEEGETFFAANPLPKEEFDENQLRDHVRNYNWNEFSKLILGDWRRSGALHSRESIFSRNHEDTEGNDDADHNHTDVYEVGEDGAPLKRDRNDTNNGDLATWEALRHTNVDKERRQAVGRIIIVRLPPCPDQRADICRCVNPDQSCLLHCI
jgi:hypothetical protein